VDSALTSFAGSDLAVASPALQTPALFEWTRPFKVVDQEEVRDHSGTRELLSRVPVLQLVHADA